MLTAFLTLLPVHLFLVDLVKLVTCLQFSLSVNFHLV